jgi:uncharacterized membrane protein
MVVPIYSFGDEPLWLKLLIAAICLYFLGLSMRSERFFRVGSVVRSLGIVAALLSALALLLSWAR